ncbi:hypothetical protein PG997_012399 [Apiospora hydei]|uniref:Uncharacterized protein n=1 Tax=Apiospora hydei TaxID=1337664 RepID=A0ABR1V3B7_9PEZI
MRDVRGGRDTGRGRPRHRRNGPWKDGRQQDDDLESEADDDVDFLSDPALPPLFAEEDDDPVDDLPPVPHNPITRLLRKHQAQQNTSRNNRHRGNSKNNPFLKQQQPHQQQQQSNLNLPSFQRQRQQQQPQYKQKRYPQRSNSKYGCNDCNDCRAVRKANVRLRNALHNHLVASAATIVEWSEEVGVPFGGGADDEMDWQPEPEIRVIVVQQQQPDDRRHNYYYYNNTFGNFLPNVFPSTRYGGPGGYRRHGVYGGSGGYERNGRGGPGLSSGHSGVGAATAPWCQQPGIDSLEEDQGTEDPLEEPPEEPYQSMALEPDPFRETPSGSGFANTSGVSPLGKSANQLNSSSGVVANHSAVSSSGILASMITNVPSIEVGEWSQPNAGNQGGFNGHAR